MPILTRVRSHWHSNKCCHWAKLFEAILPPPTALGVLFLAGSWLTPSCHCKELSTGASSAPLWFVLSFDFWESNWSPCILSIEETGKVNVLRYPEGHLKLQFLLAMKSMQVPLQHNEFKCAEDLLASLPKPDDSHSGIQQQSQQFTSRHSASFKQYKQFLF